MSISDCLLSVLSVCVSIAIFLAVIVVLFAVEFWPVWLLIAALKSVSYLI